MCRCCSPSEGKLPLVALVWSVSGCSSTRSVFTLSTFISVLVSARQVLLNQFCVCGVFFFFFFLCVQLWQNPGEREGRDQCGSYLRHWISAAWTPLVYRPLSACWDAAGPSTLQRRQHPGTQFGNRLILSLCVIFT